MRKLTQSMQSRIRDSVKKSLPSYMSGLKCWMAFCKVIEVPNFPATAERVAVYMSIFNNADTARNYLSHLKKAHQMFVIPCDFDTPAARAVIKGIEKNNIKQKVPKTRVTLDILKPFVNECIKRNLIQLGQIAVLSYWFMFRVPSECFPLQKSGKHSSFKIHANNTVSITLACRKNNPAGETLSRTCCCKSIGARFCPHAILSKYNAYPADRGLFNMKYAQFLKQLRGILSYLNIQSSERFGSHAFRRGCAEDMRKRGAPLRDILEAGGWRSAAFLLYLERENVERDAVATIAIEYSNDEDSDFEMIRVPKKKKIRVRK